eukprot:scaffold60389_cov15-Tisochrysis_lutea.AAC.1
MRQKFIARGSCGMYALQTQTLENGVWGLQLPGNIGPAYAPQLYLQVEERVGKVVIWQEGGEAGSTVHATIMMFCPWMMWVSQTNEDGQDLNNKIQLFSMEDGAATLLDVALKTDTKA